MRAFLRNNAGAIAGTAVTAAFCCLFWVAPGRGKVVLLPPVRLQGKRWVLTTTPPPHPAPAARPVAAHAAGERRPKTRRRAARKVRRRSAVPAAADVPAPPKTPPAAPAPSALPPAPEPPHRTPTQAPVPPVSAAVLDPLETIPMQALVDDYEADPAKYLLGRTTRAGGIALSVEGMERRPRLFVLKASVANDTDADFFVKGFTVRSGPAVLASRSLFRILVEPGREREGYVVFEGPRAGETVKIELKEDGGKGRVLSMALPCRF